MLTHVFLILKKMIPPLIDTPYIETGTRQTWKTTTFIFKLEEDLKFVKLEDDLKFLKLEVELFIMEDNLNLSNWKTISFLGSALPLYTAIFVRLYVHPLVWIRKKVKCVHTAFYRVAVIISSNWTKGRGQQKLLIIQVEFPMEP